MDELWKRILATGGAKVYGLLLGVVSLSLTSRLLGPEGRGTVTVLSTWVSGFMTFGYLSLGQVALHRLAGDRQGERYGAVLGSLLVFAAVVSALGWSIAAGAKLLWLSGPFAVFPPRLLAVAFVSLPFLVWEQYSSSLLMGLERLNVTNRYQIVGRTLSLIALYLFVGYAGWSVVGAIAANFVGQVVVALGGTGLLIGEVTRRRTRLAATSAEMGALLAGGLRLHVNAIGTFLFSSANVLVLHRYLGAAEAGFFSLASQLIGIMAIVPQAAGMVIYGRVAQVGPDDAWPTNRRLLLQVGGLMLAACVVALLAAPFLIRTLAGPSFEPSIGLFRWLLATIPGSVASSMMAPQWIGRGYFTLAAVITVVTGLFSFAASCLLVPRFGTDGAVGASVMTYGISLIGNGLMFSHCDAKERGQS